MTNTEKFIDKLVVDTENRETNWLVENKNSTNIYICGLSSVFGKSNENMKVVVKIYQSFANFMETINLHILIENAAVSQTDHVLSDLPTNSPIYKKLGLLIQNIRVINFETSIYKSLD